MQHWLRRRHMSLEEKEAAAAQDNDSDMDEGECCSWCFDRGVTVFCCDTCPRGFCAQCIGENLGQQELQRVEKADPWDCYVCRPKPLIKLRKLYLAPSSAEDPSGQQTQSREHTTEQELSSSPSSSASKPAHSQLERNQVLVDQLMALEDQIENEAKELEPLRVEYVEAEVRAELQLTEGDAAATSLERRVREEMGLWRSERKAAHRALDFQIKLLQEVLPPLLPKGCSLISVYRRREKFAAIQDQQEGDPWAKSVVRVKPDEEASAAAVGDDEQPGFWRVEAVAEPSWPQPVIPDKKELPPLDDELPIYADSLAELVERGVEGGDIVEEIALKGDSISSRKNISDKMLEKAYEAEERAAKEERSCARRQRRRQVSSNGSSADSAAKPAVRRMRSKLVERVNGPPVEVDGEESEPELHEFVEEQDDSSSESDSCEEGGQRRRGGGFRKRKRSDSGGSRRSGQGSRGGSRSSSWKKQPLQAPDSLSPAWQGSDSPWKGRQADDAPFVINTGELEAFEQACEEAGGEENMESPAPRTIVVHPRLACQLKVHQREGVRFMWNHTVRGNAKNRATNGGAVGCILGHCMGLGKTLQVVTIIHTIFQQRLFDRKLDKTSTEEEQTRPPCVLIVAPKNVVYNWRDEFAKWAGKVTVYLADGDMERRRRNLEVRLWHNTGSQLALLPINQQFCCLFQMCNIVDRRRWCAYPGVRNL